MDALLLGRAQFAANITFHILFPTITIALGWMLLFFKLRFQSTGNTGWMEAYRFYVKVFALCFALGVVSGITMSFQFGTNWPGFMKTVGNIAGPLLGYEVLTAFFLEATFLGIMLFGTNRVSNRIHTLATALVAFGTTLSAFWIVVLNSWMHTPSGYVVYENVFYAASWWEIIANPSMPYRFTHVLLGSGLTAAFLMAGLSAYQWVRGDRREGVYLAMRTGVYTAAVLIPLQILVGDLHGLNTLAHQPAKIAAMEGIWEDEKAAGVRLFAIPDAKEQKNHYEIQIPYLASLILTHSWDGEIKGISSFPEHPPVAPVFFAFRVMVGVGFLMLLVAWASAYTLYRASSTQPNPPELKLPTVLLYVLIAMTFSGWVATVAGWYTTEMGRQPWLVTGILRTDMANSAVPASWIATTLTAYLLVYAFLIGAFMRTTFYLARRAGDPENRLYQSPVRTIPGESSSHPVVEVRS